MSKFAKTMTTGMICACITMFFTYSMIHMSKVNSKIDEWEESYDAIHKDVSTFVKVSDPKTIRLYVNELNKILDEIHFLGKLIENGQLADDGLTAILNEQSQMNKKILDMVTKKEFKALSKKEMRARGSMVGDISDLHDLNEDLTETVENSNKKIFRQISTIESDISEIKKLLKTMNKKKFMHTHKK